MTPTFQCGWYFSLDQIISNERLLRYATNDASEMLNAILCVATNDTLAYISFIDEYHRLYHTGAEYYFPERTGIVDRNVIIGEPAGNESGGDGLASADANDVAMTVLPSAPIDRRYWSSCSHHCRCD